MNKLLNFVQGGSSKLPPGFRFEPTEEEIIFEYLFKKTFSHPLPASVVPEIPTYRLDPWDMPGDEEQDKYFFVKKETKYHNGNRVNRTTKSGYWKANGADKKIKCPKKSRDTNNLMGMRKKLAFHTGKSPNGYKTEWIMHEYRLVNSLETNANFDVQNNSVAQNLVQVGEWFFCHVYLKKRNSVIDQANKEVFFYESMKLDLNNSGASSSSSYSSCGSNSITDVTSARKNRGYNI